MDAPAFPIGTTVTLDQLRLTKVAEGLWSSNVASLDPRECTQTDRQVQWWLDNHPNECVVDVAT